MTFSFDVFSGDCSVYVCAKHLCLCVHSNQSSTCTDQGHSDMHEDDCVYKWQLTNEMVPDALKLHSIFQFLMSEHLPADCVFSGICYISLLFAWKSNSTQSVWVPTMGAGIAQWLERQTRDWKVAGSNPCRSGGRIFFSMVNFLCWLLFQCPFHPCVTAVARKIPRSFRQKCRWQVTAKHAYTLRMWLCMKWHGAWLCGLHRTCAETAAVSCGTSHASAVSTPLWWIFKKRAIESQSLM